MMFAMITWVLFHTRFMRNFWLKILQWQLDSSWTLKIQRLKTSKVTRWAKMHLRSINTSLGTKTVVTKWH